MKDLEILTAKQRAMNKFPYYGPVLARSRVKENGKCPTMSMSNRLVIEYNPQFFNKLSENAKIILVTHECMHAMSDHHHRWFVHPLRGKVSFTLANIAMDMEINQHLEKEEPDWMQENAWLPSKMDYPNGKSFEYYLDLMMQDIEEDRKKYPSMSSNSNDDKSDDNDSDSQNSEGSNESDSADNLDPKSKEGLAHQMRIHQDEYERVKQTVMDALSKTTNNINMDNVEKTDAEAQSELQDVIEECKEAMKGIGHDSCISEIIRNVPRKKYDWSKLLKSLIMTKKDDITRGRDRMTFTRVNRRLAGLNSDIIFSEKYSENKTFNLVVGIDVSGSMGNLVNEMYSRLKSIDSCKGEKSHITVVECDTQIINVMKDFEPYNNKIKSAAGGGTDMEEIPRWVEKMVEAKEMEEPDLIVIMTDNYVPWTGESKYKKKIAVLSDTITEDCPYKQYEIII